MENLPTISSDTIRHTHNRDISSYLDFGILQDIYVVAPDLPNYHVTLTDANDVEHKIILHSDTDIIDFIKTYKCDYVSYVVTYNIYRKSSNFYMSITECFLLTIFSDDTVSFKVCDVLIEKHNCEPVRLGAAPRLHMSL